MSLSRNSLPINDLVQQREHGTRLAILEHAVSLQSKSARCEGMSATYSKKQQSCEFTGIDNPGPLCRIY